MGKSARRIEKRGHAMFDLLVQIMNLFAPPSKDAQEDSPAAPPSVERPARKGAPERSFSTAELRRQETSGLPVKGTHFLRPLDVQELEVRGYNPRWKWKED